MNTLAHLAALPASLWGSIYAFQTLGEPALGGAMFIVFLAVVALTINALDDDIFMAGGRKMLKFKGSDRDSISTSSKGVIVLTIGLFALLTIASLNFGSTISGSGISAVKFIDETGQSYGIAETGNAPHVFIAGADQTITVPVTGSLTSGDFMLDVARGKIAGISHINKFGKNDLLANNVTADIWDGGITLASGGDSLIWLPPTAARIHQLASSDDEDGGAGTDTGALTIEIFGLAGNFELQQETLTLNGTTNVATAETYIIIHRMVIQTVGSSGANLGIIRATADTDGTVTARINVGNNQTLMAIFQCPAATTCYMTDLTGHILRAGGVNAIADMNLFVQPFGGGFQIKETSSLVLGGSSDFEEVFSPYKVFPAKSIIKMQGDSGTNANMLSGSFDLIMVKD